MHWIHVRLQSWSINCLKDQNFFPKFWRLYNEIWNIWHQSCKFFVRTPQVSLQLKLLWSGVKLQKLQLYFHYLQSAALLNVFCTIIDISQLPPLFRTLLRWRNKECCFLGNSNVWKLYKFDCMWKTIYGLMECHFSSWIFQKVMIFGFSDCLSPCAMPITMVA